MTYGSDSSDLSGTSSATQSLGWLAHPNIDGEIPRSRALGLGRVFSWSWQVSSFGISLPSPGRQTASSPELHFRIFQFLLGFVEFLLIFAQVILRFGKHRHVEEV